MEWKVLQTGQVFTILFLIFMVTQRIECNPSKWPPLYPLSNDTSSIHQVRSSSSIADAQESILSGRNRKEVTEESEDMDDETKRVLEEAFRTSSDDSEAPKTEHKVRPPDEMNLRRYDFKRRRRPGSFIPHNFEDRIVFPDNVDVTSPRNFQRAPTCRHGTFCEDTPYYPTELINRALRLDTNLQYLQIRDELEPTLALRSSGRDVTLCESKKHLLRPRAALNKNKEWRFIVNTENFTQAIGVEICENDKSPCKLVDNFASGYKTMCKQNFIYRELVAIASDNSISLEKFQIPASCCCHIQFVGDPTIRMGVDVRKNES